MPAPNRIESSERNLPLLKTSNTLWSVMRVCTSASTSGVPAAAKTQMLVPSTPRMASPRRMSRAGTRAAGVGAWPGTTVITGSS